MSRRFGRLYWRETWDCSCSGEPLDAGEFERLPCGQLHEPEILDKIEWVINTALVEAREPRL
jgi:hypothetical protein